jgi:GMP synthase (glutamine-hydrolysing)
MASFVEEATARVKAQVGDGRVVCGLSGGVDSTVAALIIHRAIGRNLTCILVDNGVLRQDEAAQIRKRFARLNLRSWPRHPSGFRTLAGVVEPEQKRDHRRDFMMCSRRRRRSSAGSVFWRGGPYPDVIESVAIGAVLAHQGHHNVGGLRSACG